MPLPVYTANYCHFLLIALFLSVNLDDLLTGEIMRAKRYNSNRETMGKVIRMSIEKFVPKDGEELISARVPKDLFAFIEETALVYECNRTEAICKLLKYAHDVSEVAGWIRVIDGFRPTKEMIAHAMTVITSDRDARRKFFQKQRTLEKAIENRIHPAIIDAGRNACRTVAAFQPTKDGQPDKIANRTTDDGFRLGGTATPATPTIDMQEGSGDRSTGESVMAAGAIATETTRKQHDDRTRRRAKKRGDSTVMSGSGWA